MTVDETTRTPNPNDGDAPANTETAGTSGKDERNAASEGELKITKDEALGWKGKAEVLNSLFAKYGVSTVEELNEVLAQSPAAPAPTSPEPVADDEELQATIDHAKRGDPVAKLALRLLERQEQLTRGVGDAFSVREIEDVKLRRQAVAHYEKNRHRLGDVNAALAEIEAPRLRAELRKATEELERLKKPPDPDVTSAPPQPGREITSMQTQSVKKMRESDFDAEQARLKSLGLHREAMRQQQLLNADKIELLPG